MMDEWVADIQSKTDMGAMADSDNGMMRFIEGWLRLEQGTFYREGQRPRREHLTPAVLAPPDGTDPQHIRRSHSWLPWLRRRRATQCRE